MSNEHASRSSASAGGSTQTSGGASAGKASSTSRLTASGSVEPVGGLLPTAYDYAPAGASPPGDDPFGLHLGGGQSLPDSSRAAAEHSLGVDLSDVRVHTGPAGEEAAAGLSAQAFTQGNDIVFGAGSYAPGTAAGDHLVAHELVHVAQQSGAAAAPQLKGVTSVDEPAELEADRGADAILAGQRFDVHERPTGIARRTLPAESISGNPAERGSGTAAGATTTHRTPTLGDAVNAPAAPTAAPTDSRPANVKINAPRDRPLRFDGPVSPRPELIFEEGEQVSPPPSGFTAVTAIQGTGDQPMVEQAADSGIYINNQPTPDDVQQGGIGDCYCEATLMSMAQRDPGKIKSMMVANGSGGATVTLWRRQAHQRSILERIFGGGDTFDYAPVQVSVNQDLAVNISNNRVHGAQLRAAPTPKNVEFWGAINGSTLEVHRKDLFEVARWAPLMEKAYARFAQQYGQEGGFTGVGTGAAAGTAGYDAINSGFSQYCMRVFYGPAADAAGAISMEGMTAFPTAGNNILAANPAVVDRLLLLAGRQDTPQPGETTSPVITAFTDPEAQIRNLNTAITNAIADPDYTSLSATVRTKITTLQTAIATYNTTPPDPAGTPGPKAAARQAVGNAAVEVARTPNDDHLAELRRHAPTPVEFDNNSDAPKASFVPRLNFFGQWLEYVSVASLCPFVVNYVGHASSEGTEPDNQALSERRATNTDVAVKNGRDATKMARHTYNTSGVGETGAAATPAWRRVDITIEHGAPSNELFDGARTAPIRAMMDLVLNVRNLGTDNSTGQRNIYASHAYSVVGVNFVTTTGVVVPLQSFPQASRAPLYPLVDCEVSTIRVRNPHHGNEPDRTGMGRPTRPGDGAPSGPTSDGSFTVSVNEFFRNFNFLETGVFPTT